VRGYFLYLHHEKKSAPSTINIAVHGLRFFFIHTLSRDWPVFELLRVNKRHKLPVVLSEAEVRAVLGVIRNPGCRAALTTIYALGLRLSEGIRIESGHVDSGRLIVWVRDSKLAGSRTTDTWYNRLPAKTASHVLSFGNSPPERLRLM
jgi:integrase